MGCSPKIEGCGAIYITAYTRTYKRFYADCFQVLASELWRDSTVSCIVARSSSNNFWDGLRELIKYYCRILWSLKGLEKDYLVSSRICRLDCSLWYFVLETKRSRNIILVPATRVKIWTFYSVFIGISTTQPANVPLADFLKVSGSVQCVHIAWAMRFTLP